MSKEVKDLLVEYCKWCNAQGGQCQLNLDGCTVGDALAILTEQPPAGDLAKEAIELDKMCVSEIVAKYESSHNAIAVLKRKFREACESDEWRKSATEFYENGGCPICFSTDEAGCTEGCYLGQLQAKLTEQPPAGEFTKKFREHLERSRKSMGFAIWTRAKEACTRLDRSESENRVLRKPLEAANFKIDGMLAVGRKLIKQDMQIKELEASRKELLTACEKIQQYNKSSEKGQLNPDDAHDYWDSVMSYIDVAIEKANKQGD